MTTVYFATNRVAIPNSNDFGADIVPFDPNNITFAVANVTNVQLPDESSGVINSINDRTPANFSQAATKAIIGANQNLVIFIHGFDNSFSDAIKRAAFNREWLAASNSPQANTQIIAFTWPSEGKLIAAPSLIAPDAYQQDQVQAGRSAFHIAYFMRVMQQLAESYRAANPAGRITLLAHSMGNHALSGAIQLWFASNDPVATIFDDVILAAADEQATTLDLPALGQMTALRSLAGRITVYHSRLDVAMYLSTTINQNQRLGFDGPPNKHDTTVFPSNKFRIVDCTDVLDYSLYIPPDASHQYYRRSVTVRNDMVLLLEGKQVAGGVIELSAPMLQM